LCLLLLLLAGAELMQAAPVELGMRVTRRAQWLATAIAIGVKLLLVSRCCGCCCTYPGLCMPDQAAAAAAEVCLWSSNQHLLKDVLCFQLHMYSHSCSVTCLVLTVLPLVALPLCCCCWRQVPLLNVALIRAAGMHSLVPAEDKVYQLLLLVEAAVPAAVTLLVVCGRVYPDIRPLSQMLFWQYVASLLTLPAFLVWFIYMLDL
jgi:hypothetical protein